MPHILKKIIDIGFNKKINPTGFLTNFFEPVQLKGFKVEIHGKSVKAIYSVDVKKGTGGRRYDLGSFDSKEFEVPEYNDFTTLTEEDLVKIQFGESPYEQTIANIADMAIDKYDTFSAMQRLAEEKQAADALFQGKIVLSDGSVIEFNKKDTHNISKSSTKWNSTSNPIDDLEKGCDLCIKDASLTTSEFNFISSGTVVQTLLSNENVIKSSNWNNGIQRTQINIPEEKSPGASFHGQLSCGSKKVNIWSYDRYYEVPSGFGFANEGSKFGFIPTGRGLLLPSNPSFKRYYGALADINEVNNNTTTVPGFSLTLKQQQQLPYIYAELKNGSAYIIVGEKSRPLVVPIDIDCFVTFSDLI